MTQVLFCVSCGRSEPRVRQGRTLFCFECAEQHGREQRRAIAQVAAAIKRGHLPKPTETACADCGAPAKQYDHRDYTEPLAVDPVCIPCNYKRGPALDSQMRAVLREGETA